MLRFSDDELPGQDSQGKKSDASGVGKPSSDKKPGETPEVVPNKPNFVYIVCLNFTFAALSNFFFKYCFIIFFPIEYYR